MKILVCGDYIVYGKETNKLDNPFGKFKKIIRQSDIAIYNQEFPITAETKYYPTKKYGLLAKTDPDMIKPIIDAGFSCACLANNHVLNYGVRGITDTINILNKNNILAVGAGETIGNALEILYIKKDNVKVAILNFAENEFNTASWLHGGANPLNVVNVVRSINEAKQNAEIVLLIIHGGIDYCKIPSSRIVKLYRFFAECGADAIFGHHTHVVSGYETHNDVPIFYGVGNFIPGKIVTKDCLYTFPVQLEISNNKIISFQGFPLKWNLKINKLIYLSGENLEKFNSEQSRINLLLSDIDKLTEEIKQSYLTKERESYYFTLFTRSNYFLFKLFRKLRLVRVYHRYISQKMRLNKKNSVMWNIFRCETHRDVLDLIYEKYIDTYKND